MAKKDTLLEKLINSRIVKSIFRHGYPDNEIDQSLTITSNAFLHIHPVKIRKHALNFFYTLGLGGISLLFFLITLFTGVFLMFYYIPSTNSAYHCMKDLEFAVFFGMMMRNMHRWAAHGMVAAVFLHMCRVFYTGSYQSPREFNWFIGLIILVITIAFSYSGYLLPWDQLAYWGINVGTEIAASVPVLGEKISFLLKGGNIIDQNTLLRFYVIHCILLPVVLSILLMVHFWRIRKDGGISGPPLTEDNLKDRKEGAFALDASKTYNLMALPKVKTTLAEKEPEDTVMTFPHLVRIELVYAILVTAILLITSYVFNAPLEEVANPELVPSPAKAPWYFLGLQEMISWSTPFYGGVLYPTLIILVLAAIPYFDRNPAGVGVWYAKERRLICNIFTLWVIFMGILILIGTYCRGPGWVWYWPWEEWVLH
jgi:quinol-cytochrome oxidoreductase complex cytochrome b subunit